MGKGDSKTKKGKMFRKSYGIARPGNKSKKKKLKEKQK